MKTAKQYIEEARDEGRLRPVEPLRFSGKDGLKPYTEARRYVYDALAITLGQDIKSAGYLNDDLPTDADRRRAQKAAKQILRELEKKAVGR